MELVRPSRRVGQNRALLIEVAPVTFETHGLARGIAERHQLKIYDACIIASASLAGCKTLYTEDLTDGAVIAGVAIVNPFKNRPTAAP